MRENGIEFHSQSCNREAENRKLLLELIKSNPVEEKYIIWNQSLFLNRHELTRIISFYRLYKKIIKIPGIIMEFGVHYGRDISVMINLRGMLEPFNYLRKIIGFDTFEGLPELHKKDEAYGKKGDFSVVKDYEPFLERLLTYHEQESPIFHVKKYELIKGNLIDTLPIYLENNPQTIISFAYFDVDLYEPTKRALELIKPYLVKGSVLAFDETNFYQFPGETIAINEVLGLNNLKLRRFTEDPPMSYTIFK